MKFTINLDKKIFASFVAGGLLVGSAFYLQPTKAQAVTTLSGQYGCIMNRNFGGYAYSGLANPNITGSNFMMYFDFTGRSVQYSIVGLTQWGTTSPSTAVASLASGGVLSAAAGPLTNSFVATADMTYGGSSGHTMKFNLMSVNGGTTLLLQSGIGGTDDGEPATGVCNKV